MKQTTISADAIIKITLGSAWLVSVIALAVLSVLGIGERENIVGLLVMLLALGGAVSVRARKSLGMIYGKFWKT